MHCTVDETLELISDAGVSCSTILNIAEISESEHVKMREMVIEIVHRVAGKTRISGNPVKVSEIPIQIDQHSPALGEYSSSFLQNRKESDESEL